MEACSEEQVPKEVLEALESQLTSEMIERLVTYAEWKVRKRHWQGIRGAPMPEGLEPKDLVPDAVEKVLDGRRRWDPTEQPDLFKHLTGVIDSDVNHAAMSAANRHVRDESVLMAAEGMDGPPGSYFDGLPGDEDPEAIMVTEEEEARSDRFLWGLLKFLADKPLLQQMVECIVDDVTKPREIAEKLGVKSKDIYNATKQLARRLEAYRAQWLAQESN
jgi:hypothetical protein